MANPFAVSKEDRAGVAWLSVTGEIDQDVSACLATFLTNAVTQPGVTEVVVDLRHVTFLAAAGVRALLSGHEAATGRGCAYRVVNAYGLVREVLVISASLSLLSPAPDPQLSEAAAR
ncbi:STAS domain-containing protein [Actinoplanes sp. CA-030573]|uniref:STAS domain-containing protein n=1 Tax=Actinoplanes sp. CA-030573 TaxID=3239898 RepID=UPI003D8EE19C